MIILFLLLLLIPQTALASVLSDAAASLSPGQWTVISPVAGTMQAIIQNTCELPTTYTDSAVWDPVGHKMRYIGGYGHIGGYCHIVYDEATNAYSSGPAITGTPFNVTGGPLHQYDMHAIDVVNRRMYYSSDRSVWQFSPSGCAAAGAPSDCFAKDLWRFDIASNTWATLPQNLTLDPGISGCCVANTWFPEMNGLVRVTAEGRVRLFTEATQAWTSISNGVSGAGGTMNWAEYNPVKHIVLFGSAAHVFKLQSNGVITEMAPPPSTMYDGSWNANVLADPVTGIFLFYTVRSGGANYTLYSFNSDTNVFTLIGNPPQLSSPAIYQNLYGGITSWPISNYGVVATQICGADLHACDGRILLFKYAQTLTPDQDFASRCNAAGVTTCLGFNTKGAHLSGADIICCNGMGSAFTDTNVDGFSHSTTVETVSVDNTIKTSGAGSMKITAAAGQSSGHIGQFICCGDGQAPPGEVANKGLGHKYKPGEILYVQYRVRFSTNFFHAGYDYWQSPSKISIFHYQGFSCGALEITTNSQLNLSGNKAQGNGYVRCGAEGWRHWVTDLATHRTVAQGIPYSFQAGAYNCPYPGGGTDGAGGCFYFPVDEWITLYYKITMPPTTFDQDGGKIEIWYARDGDTSYTKWINLVLSTTALFNCHSSSPPCPNDGFDNVTLLMHPNSATGPAPYDVSMWFDEFIASSQPIAIPGTTSVPPVAPSNVKLTRRGV